MTTTAAPATSGSTSAARTSSGPSWSTTAAPGRPSTATRCRPARGRPGAVPAAVTAQLGRGRAAGDRRLRARSLSVGIGVPGLYDPATGHDPVPRQRPGTVGRAPGGRTRRGRRGLPAVPHQRRPGLRPRGAAAGRRAGRPLDGRAHAGHGRRRRHRDRRPRPPGPRRDGRRDRPPDDRPRRAVVRLRQPRLPRGVRPGRPDRGGLRDRDGRGGRARARRPATRRPRRARRRSGATWASGSPT